MRYMSKFKILILQGTSGAGKSTYAENLYKNDPDNIVVVSRDTLRQQLLGEINAEKYTPEFNIEKTILGKEQMRIVQALKSGRKVVIDNTNLRKAYVKEYVKLAIDLGIPEEDVKIKTFTVGIDEAAKRVFLRGHTFVPRMVIERQADQLRSATWTIHELFEEVKESGYVPRKWHVPPFNVEPYIPPKKKRLAILCDIDGTLAHRKLLLYPTPHYRSFFDYKDCSTDEVDRLVATVLKSLHNSGIKIIFVSGRKQDCKKETHKFLYRALGLKPRQYKLFMRDIKYDRNDPTDPTKDDSDDIVKYRLFNKHIRKRYDVLGVIDDRKRVVALWEALGLRVMNVGKLNEEF